METEEVKSITGIIRGCGKRVPGGLYVCSGNTTYGSPLENFIIDPPIPYDTEPFRAPIIFEKEGKNHLILYVGSEYYPYCSDFIEEVRKFGVSKRIPTKFPVEKLESGSMIFLVHPKAIIRDHSFMPLPDFCPSLKSEHLESIEEFCLGHAYTIAEPNSGANERKLGDTVYTVYPQSMGEIAHEFQPGIFLRVPVTHFDHVMDKGNINPDIAAKKSKLPINFEKE